MPRKIEPGETIRREHEACCRAAGDALTHAMNAGELLAQAKAQCQHGQWSQWLADNFCGSDRTARAYMRIAKHREVIEAKRQSSADLTLERALKYLTPRAHEPNRVDPVQLELDDRRREEGLAQSVLTFDELANVAESFGDTHEEAYQTYYAECKEPGGDLPSFDEHKQQIEQWRSAPWFDSAVRRVQAEKIVSAERDHVLGLIDDAEKSREYSARCFREWSKESRELLSNVHCKPRRLAERAIDLPDSCHAEQVTPSIIHVH